ncbi:MAG: helix-turn-helix transcriptional regulator [Butyrivibrio sp.]|nr:helix-turn-helix transcriptional regulator [Butyrivibrio sp.]
MAVSYKKLFHMLIDINMTAAELQKEAGYSANISTRMRRNEYVSLDSIEKICRVLGCKIDDIVEFIPEKNLSAHNKKQENTN